MKYVTILTMCLMMLLLSACSTVDFQPTSKHYGSYDSVVLVKLPSGGWGSGVIIGENKILTAAHVAETSDTFTIVEKDGDTYTATKLWSYAPGTLKDYAVLVAEDISEAPVNVSCNELVVGQSLVHVGYPVTASEPTRIRTYGRIASLDFGDDRYIYDHAILVDLLAGPGSSGGAIFSHGQLVGLLVGGVKVGARRGIGGLSIVIVPPLCSSAEVIGE